ncbi:MAG: hypothetical protein PHU23_07890 [Dehalococcoidales bacterium]|nr:hypothetical protein [Dehalococcoidales bacterium]
MTDEELELALKDVNARIEQFGVENKLADKEWRNLQQLKREKSLLENIRKARANNNFNQETKNMMQYNLIKHEKNMNPFLKYLMHLKLRGQIWW